MSYPDQNGHLNNTDGAAPSPAEVTLRLIASLPAPEGLEDRVQAGLRAGLDVAPHRARVLAWPIAAAGEWMRAAAAAAIVFVVAGGGWGIYAHVQPGQPLRGISGTHGAGPGQFSSGGAVRRPLTLVGPIVKVPQATVTPKPKAPGKLASKSTRAAKLTAAAKSIAQPASTPAR